MNSSITKLIPTEGSTLKPEDYDKLSCFDNPKNEKLMSWEDLTNTNITPTETNINFVGIKSNIPKPLSHEEQLINQMSNIITELKEDIPHKYTKGIYTKYVKDLENLFKTNQDKIVLTFEYEYRTTASYLAKMDNKYYLILYSMGNYSWYELTMENIQHFFVVDDSNMNEILYVKGFLKANN